MIASSERVIVGELAERPAASQWRKVGARFLSHRLALAGSAILIVLGLAAALAPLIARYSPTATDLAHITAAPTWAHPLGTDELGRDVLTRLIYGGRASLMVGVCSMLLAATLGVTYGAVAGFFGGVIDTMLMRFVDFVLSFPALFVLLILASYYHTSVVTITLYIGCLGTPGWMGMARLVRGQILSLREQDFITAVRSMGASSHRIILRHLLPNAVAPVIVAATLGVASAMLTEAALDFLGFGVPPDTPTWGNLITNAEDYLTSAPALAIAPGLVITLAVVSINFIGDALRDALDPYSQRRR
jgi:peptide/nickel transport system permease protein